MIHSPDITARPCTVALKEAGVDQGKAPLQGRTDLLAELERAREALRIFANGPAPEFQGDLRRRPRY